MSDIEGRAKSNEIGEEKIGRLYKNILYVAYSSLYEQIGDERMIKKIEGEIGRNKPEKIENPYKFKIYGRERTDDNKKIKKIKVGGRDSYVIDKGD